MSWPDVHDFLKARGQAPAQPARDRAAVPACVPPSTSADDASTRVDLLAAPTADPVAAVRLATGRPARRMCARVREFVSELRRASAPGLSNTRPVGYYLRQAIHNHMMQALPPRGVVDLRAAQRYSRARARLPLSERELVVGALELGYTDEQLALATNRASAEAARSAVESAVRRLAEEMSRA